MKRKFTGTVYLSSVMAAAMSLLVSCQIGLGAAVDVTGPEVQIVSPVARQNVNGSFEIRGTVEDNVALGTLSVKCEDSEWVFDAEGNCKARLNGASSYTPYANSLWTVDASNSRKASWVVSGVNINSEGKHDIKVSSSDSFGNSSGFSVKTRLVIVDTTPPLVTVKQPSVKVDIRDAKEEYGSMVDHHNPTKLKNIITGAFAIEGNQQEENNLKYLKVILRDEAGTEFFGRRLIQYEDYREDASDILVKSLRSWRVDVSDSDLQSYAAGKKYFEILTESSDVSNNVVSLESKGFMLFWKDADKSWTDVQTGSEGSPRSFYSGSKLTGTSYDDKPVRNVRISCRKRGGPAEPDVLLVPDADLTTYYWSYDVPTEAGSYELSVVTNYGESDESDSKTVHIRVEDIRFPELSVIAPVQSATMFGNENGDVEIRTLSKDDDSVRSVKFVYLKNEADTIKYSDANYSAWNGTEDVSAVEVNSHGILKRKTDGNGNMVYSIKLVERSDLDESIPGMKRKQFDGNATLNLFEDFRIADGTYLKNQHFIFRVEDGNGNASTFDYSVMGDIDAPSISITSVKIGDAEYSDKSRRLPSFKEDKLIKIKGRWSDNSFEKWRRTDKLKLAAKINGTDASGSLNGDGTFVVSGAIPASASLLDAKFYVKITDAGTNTCDDEWVMLVNNQEPVFQYFTASESEGNYGKGSSLKILMHFNKPIKVTGTPEITLNNGAVPSYSGTEGNDLIFLYTISEGDDVSGLKINKDGSGKFGLSLEGATLKDENGTAATVVLRDENNLDRYRKINIVTRTPALSAASFSDGNSKLVLDFGMDVSKGTGNITLVQNTQGLKIPAVVSVNEYRNFESKAPALARCYRKGTNGTNSGYDFDTSTKYILDFSRNTDDSALVKYYTDAGLHKVVVSVNSNSVTAKGSELEISLDGSNELPCKGADYKVYLGEGIVKNAVGIGNIRTADSDARAISAVGVEMPFIRVNTTEWTYDATKKCAVQPFTADVKFDCETPGAVISYAGKKYTMNTRKVFSKEYDYSSMYIEGSGVGSTEEINGSGVTKGTFGESSDGTNPSGAKGLRYEIKSSASLDKNGTEFVSEPSYAKVVRTIISVQGFSGKYYSDSTAGNRLDQIKSNVPSWKNYDIGLWVKGSDIKNNGYDSEGLPLSFNPRDDKSGLMTKDGDKDFYYYVSWNINVPALYFLFMAGPVGADSNVRSPVEACFLQNNWTGAYDQYPVHAGDHINIRNWVNNKEGTYTNAAFEAKNLIKCR